MNSSQFLAQLRLCVFEMQAGMAQTWLCTIFPLCTHEIETNIHVLACHPTMGARFEPLAGAANGHVPPHARPAHPGDKGTMPRICLTPLQGLAE